MMGKQCKQPACAECGCLESTFAAEPIKSHSKFVASYLQPMADEHGAAGKRVRFLAMCAQLRRPAVCQAQVLAPGEPLAARSGEAAAAAPPLRPSIGARAFPAHSAPGAGAPRGSMLVRPLIKQYLVLLKFMELWNVLCSSVWVSTLLGWHTARERHYFLGAQQRGCLTEGLIVPWHGSQHSRVGRRARRWVATWAAIAGGTGQQPRRSSCRPPSSGHRKLWLYEDVPHEVALPNEYTRIVMRLHAVPCEAAIVSACCVAKRAL